MIEEEWLVNHGDQEHTVFWKQGTTGKKKLATNILFQQAKKFKLPQIEPNKND